MLIGFDASRAFVPEATGTENYSLSLLKALAKVDRKNRYRVYIRHGASFMVNGSLGKVTKKSPINDEQLTMNFNWPANFEFVLIGHRRFWTQLGLALETWRNPVDVLFVPAHTLPILRRRSFIANGLWGKFLLSRLTINDQRLTKYLVTIHDLGVEYLPGHHQFPQRYYLDFASKYAAGHADAIITVSQATKDDLASRYKVGRKKVFVVHEGVDTSFFKPSSKLKRQSVKSKYGIKGDYILFVGTVQPRKNLQMLIKAFSLLVHSSRFTVHRKIKTVNRQLTTDNCQLIIAGKLGWDYQEILDAPQKYGVEKQVMFLNYVDKRDLPALYSGAAVFAFPSLFEGFGLPILEALSCGCGVIASDIAPHREILGKIRNSKFEIRNSHFGKMGEPIVLAKVNDVNKWARILYQYISQYDIRRSLASNRRVLASKFSWDEAARQTIDVFKKLA